MPTSGHGRGAAAGNDITDSGIITGDGNQTNRASADLHLALTADDWVIAQIQAINAGLSQVNQKLGKLDQIDDALTGNRLYGRLGLVADVHKLWAWIVGIVITLAILVGFGIAQWYMLWRIWVSLYG